MAKQRAPRFILLPTRGMRSHLASSPLLTNFLASVHNAKAAVARAVNFAIGAKPNLKMSVLDSIHEDGAKLVEMTQEIALALRTEQPGLRVVPEVFFKSMVHEFKIEEKVKPAAGAVSTRIKLKIVSKADNKPIAGVNVVAFTNFAARQGAQGTTNSQGDVSLNLGASKKKLERLYAFPHVNFWGALRKNITITTGNVLGLDPVDTAFEDCVRHFYGAGASDDGNGIKVAVVDCGVDLNHPDLTVAGGENTVLGEQPDDFGDNGDGHGTHVAGIIGAHGEAPDGITGIAPGVSLFSYRVFGKGDDGASNFSIAKAIDRAVAEGCDLINMSLGGGPADDATRSAISDARGHGSVVLVAAGNDDRSPVSFPAAFDESIAVSAMGRKGTFPSGSSEFGDVARPFGEDADNFVAAFSNIGPEIDVTGPGVGVLSTFPGGHAPLSGTSMACPAVCGIAARFLAKRTDIINMPRDQARADAIMQAIFQAAKLLDFGAEFEGRGLPQ